MFGPKVNFERKIRKLDLVRGSKLVSVLFLYNKGYFRTVTGVSSRIHSETTAKIVVKNACRKA